MLMFLEVGDVATGTFRMLANLVSDVARKL